jgi:putative SOS response-associated peptidase YedK
LLPSRCSVKLWFWLKEADTLEKMCARFTLVRIQYLEELLLAAGYHHHVPLELTPRFNIAPTQTVAALRRSGEAGTREFAMLRWGLIPSWADDVKIGAKLVNARSETVAIKPSFRAAFKQRRCLIFADGYYEWQKQGKKKQPYYLGLRNERPFAFAGLWEKWMGSDGNSPIESCSILTTHANELVAPIHDRMPVVLHQEDFSAWLDTEARDVAALTPLLQPLAAEDMIAFPVSTRVNSWKNDDPSCVAPLN